MEFLADESCDFHIVSALRDAGHNVVAVAEISPRAADPDVMRLATGQNRVLLTEDKDFGQLVFAGSAPSGGVVFFRYVVSARQSVIQTFMQLIQEKGGQLRDSFVVIEPGRYRLKPRPASGPKS
jgi:predicted nuclease of predicted toxin-antitoxin system